MLNSVQYLRAIAALAVVLFHALINVYGVQASRDDHRIAILASGVDLFFVISGFIMVTSTADRQVTPVEFLRARLVRIVPLYWLWTAIALAFAVAVTGNAMPPARELMLSLAFISYTDAGGGKGPVYNPGWTLNFEMCFYVLFASALLLRELRTRVTAIVLAMLALVALRPLIGRLGMAAMDWTSPLLLEFAVGVVLGALHRQRRIPAPLLLIAAGLVLLAVSVAFSGFGMHRVAYAGVPCALALAGLVTLDHRLPTLASLALLGDASYSIYLSHSVTLRISERLWPMQDSLPAAAFAVALSAMIGIGCYRLVEQPLLRWARTSRASRRTAAAAAS